MMIKLGVRAGKKVTSRSLQTMCTYFFIGIGEVE